MLSKTIKRLKGLISLTIFLIVIGLIVTGCQTSTPIYTPGSYINEAEGYYSTLIVEVTVDETHILSIDIVSHEEPEILSELVFKRLIPMMKKKNSYEVDVISGATYTSRALIEAIEKALEQAKEAQ